MPHFFVGIVDDGEVFRHLRDPGTGVAEHDVLKRTGDIAVRSLGVSLAVEEIRQILQGLVFAGCALQVGCGGTRQI